MNNQEFIEWLKDEQGYPAAKDLGDGRYAAIYPLLFTCAILVGEMGDMTGYNERYCFENLKMATEAFHEWNGVGEPKGWHRHLPSGRRRDLSTGREWVEI